MASAEGDGPKEPSGVSIGRRTKSRNRLVEWILVDGDRIHLTFGGSAVIFALFLLLHYVGAIAFLNVGSITRMGSGMIAGTFSLVTLVVSVNQLILSQELSPVGEFRERLADVMEFRRDVEDEASIPATPAAPSRMLDVLAAGIRHRANALADAVDENEDEEYGRRIVRYADSVVDSTERIDELDGSDGNAFDALSTAVEYNHTWQLYGARHLRNDAPSLADETVAAFDELIQTLRLFSAAQEHFKTIYLQRELTRFSQLTIYGGVPAVLASVLVILLYGGVGGATVSATYLPYVTSLLATVVLLPLVLLAAYILRTATLARRTAAVGPILPEKRPGEGPFEVSYGETE